MTQIISPKELTSKTSRSKRKRRNRGREALDALSPLETNLLQDLQSGKGLQEALAPMLKRVIEASLEGEMDTYMEEYEPEDEQYYSNRKNGKSSKTMKSSFGEFELETPRDRLGEFEPQLVKKRQTKLAEDIDSKILSLFASGLSYSDIQDAIMDLYQIELSSGAINNITDRLLPEIREWKERLLQTVYPIVFLDAMHFKAKENGKIINKAVYTILGIDCDGRKDILGLYTGESEGAKYWTQVLASLKERGVQDIFIACIDGLKGFPEAINAIFPKTEIQLCIIHQIRNSCKYVSHKNQKEFVNDLKNIYKAPDKNIAEEYLLDLDEKWGKKYPLAVKPWNNNWEEISNFFKFDQSIRKIIYTTNIVEGVHRMVRKYTKSKGAFMSETALEKIVYCAYKKIMVKWSQPIPNWAIIASQLDIHFEGRFR